MRRALPLLVVLAFLPVAPASASVLTRTGPIHGEILATATSGEDLVVARRPVRGPVRVELHRPGAPTRLLLRATPPVPAQDEDYDGDTGSEVVSLAASSQAVAVAIAFDGEELGPSRTYVGTPTEGLRQVAGCGSTLLPVAVAVDGGKATWSEGGCVTTGRGLGVGAASVVSGGVRLGDVPERMAAPPNTVVGGVTMRGSRGVVALLSPRFFGFAGELRTFAPDGLGEPFQTEEFGFLSPTGILDDGTLTLTRSSFDDDDDDRRCTNAAEVIVPGTNARRVVNVGGCLRGDDEFIPTTGPPSQGAGGRLVSVVDAPAGAREQFVEEADDRVRPITVTSVRPGTRGVERIVSGTYRPPRAVSTQGSRVVYANGRCDGDQEVTVVDGPTGRLASCTLRVRTRRARLRGGRIGVAVSCPEGCRSRIYDETSCGFGQIGAFRVQRGSRRIFIRVPPGARRIGRLVVRIETENGPTRRAEIRLNG